MDISGLGFGTALSIGQRGEAKGAGDAGLFAGLVEGDGPSAKDEALKLLGEMTEGGLAGYWKWMIKTMREKLRADVMEGMGVTQEQLDAMPADQRKDIEAKITEEVERRLKAWVEQQVRKQQDVADQQRLEQTMAALGVVAEMINPDDVAKGQPDGEAGKDWLNLDGKKAPGLPLAALPTPEQLKAAGYTQDDIVRRIVEGRLHDDDFTEGAV